MKDLDTKTYYREFERAVTMITPFFKEAGSRPVLRVRKVPARPLAAASA